MLKKARFVMCIVLLGFGAALAQPVIPDPVTLKSLDSLEKAGDLINWLYRRIDYAYAKPKESLGFLMDTEKAAWRKPKSREEKEAWLMLLSNQGYNQLYAGNIIESIDRYERAYNYYTEHRLNVEGIADYVLKPWANNYTRLGDYEKALFIQQKTLDYALKENNTSLAIAMYNNMAISYRSMGDLHQAEHYTMLGLKRSTADAPEVILLNNTLADIYKEKNLLDKAEQIILDNIARQNKRSPTFETAYWLLSSYISAGDIFAAKNQFKTAERYYQLGMAINEKYYRGNRLREKANMITQIGKVKLRQNHPLEALPYFDQTLKSFGLIKADGSIDIDRIFGDNRIIEVFYQKALTYQLLNKDERALESMRMALLAADKIRFELADVKTRQRFQAETKRMALEAVAIAYRLLERTKQHRYAETILHIFEQSKARTLLDDIRKNQQQLLLQSNDTLFIQKQRLERSIVYNEKLILQEEDREQADAISKNVVALRFKLDYIEKRLKDKYPALKDATQPSVPGRLLQELPAELHFIEFFVGQQDWYALEIRNKRISHVKRFKNAPQLKDKITSFVNTYYKNGPSAMSNEPRKFFEASHSIYQTLLGGFSLKKQNKTIIIPDEVLGYLSFDGLITDKEYTPSISKWPFLIRESSLSYAFSIQTWLSQSRKKSKSNNNFSGLFITHQQGNRQFIPSVGEEADAIEALVSGDFIRDDKATAKRFFKAFDQSSVLHISTHAYLSGEQKEPTLGFEDAQVFLFELSARKHTPSLVVLSACRTADGMMAEGEGIISLSRGFAAIGTQGTIAGLWNVNDNAAAAITAGSYQNLLEGKEISTALRMSKLSWLQNKRSSEQEYLPYYWDALIFMGYDQPINLQAVTSLQLNYPLIATALILFAAIIWLALKRRRPEEAS